MSLHPDPEQIDKPFHYSGIVVELSEAMKHCLQAQDWLERPPLGVSSDDAKRQERGNLIAALTHLRNAFTAIDGRYADVHYVLRVKEHKLMAAADEFAEGLPETTVTPLPPSASLPPTPDFDR